MHTSIDVDVTEPLWVMVPVDPSTVSSIDSISINFSEGYSSSILVDRFSQSKAK